MTSPANANAANQETSSVQIGLGNFLFGNRLIFLLLFLLASCWFAYQASQLRPHASFLKMLPISHSYIVNYLENRADLSGLGNSVRIIVETTDGDIFTQEFQDTLKAITDDVFYIKGVDRAGMQSLWTPNVRWQEVTEDGFVGGTVIPDAFFQLGSKVMIVKAFARFWIGFS